METIILESFRAAMVAGICYCLYPPNLRKAFITVKAHFDKIDELEERIETHIIRGHHIEEIT